MINFVYKLYSIELVAYGGQVGGRRDGNHSNTVSRTYGEITYAGLQKVLNVFSQHGMRTSSTVTWVGFGFGREALYTSLLYQVNIEGFEAVPERVNQANIIADAVLMFVYASNFIIHSLRRLKLDDTARRRLSLTQGDATQQKEFRGEFVYFYDKVSKGCLKWIEAIINRSPNFKLFASFQPPTAYNLLSLVESFRIRTIGNEQFTCYIYKKMEQVAPTRF